MTTASQKFFDLGSPRAETGASGVKRFSGVGAAGGVVVPSSLWGKILKIKCSGAAVQLAFHVSDTVNGGAAATLTTDIASTYAAGSALAGEELAVGESDDFKIPTPENASGEVRLLWVGAAGTRLTVRLHQGLADPGGS